MITKDLFIQRANIKHGNKYDYSLVQYTGMKTKVEIICPKHGSFWQIPASHTHKTQRCGCKKCSIEETKKTTEEFIQEAQEIHGDKYSYEQTIYTNVYEKVNIKCIIHGFFSQSASDHIHSKAGCPKCIDNTLIDTNEFIRRAKITHRQ